MAPVKDGAGANSLISQDQCGNNPGPVVPAEPVTLRVRCGAFLPGASMIVQCTNCRARFRVADEKVPDRGVKMRCTKCATVFRVTRADAIEPTGKQTAARDTFGLGREPTPSPAPSPRASPSDFDLGLDLGGPSAPPTPPRSNPGERTTSPAPARSVIQSMPRAPSAIDAAFDAALATGTDPFADLGFEAPAPRPAPTLVPPATPPPDPGFASHDPFAELADQAASTAPPDPSFATDPFAAAAPDLHDPFAETAPPHDPFAAAAPDPARDDPFADPAREDPFASAAPTPEPKHDPFGELPPTPPPVSDTPDFGDLDESPQEQVAFRSGAQEFDFSENSVGESLDLNLAAVGLSDQAASRTEVGQLNLAAKVAERPITARQSAGSRFRRDLASALFNVASACIVGFAALVAIASLRSPRALTVDDLGFDLVWIAMGYTQPATSSSGLAAVDVSSGTYLTATGQELFYVRGQVENEAAAPRPAVHVAVEVVRSGNLLGRAEALAHVAAGPEDLYWLDSRDNDALQRRLAKEVDALSVAPRGRAPFLAVFPLGAHQVDGAELRLSVLDGVPPALADAVKVQRPAPQAPEPSAEAGAPEQQ